MTTRNSIVRLAMGLLLSAPPLAAQGAQALTPILGRWQSDTTDGNSALSDCRRTPQGGGVLCEQTVTTPTGVRHVESLFTFDSTSRYFLYVVSAPGDTVQAVPITISGPTWTYGGTEPASNGKWWRTINEFPGGTTYSWRLESSGDGKAWSRVMGGRSRLGAPAASPEPDAAAPLRPIVGRWQSDTTNGTSARSECVETPAERAVLCEQAVTAPDAIHHALDLFVPGPAATHAVFYLVQHPGDPLAPVPLTIDGLNWIYGGEAPDPDGGWGRTVNTFSGDSTYAWRRETSADGERWAQVLGGRSKRAR